MKKGCLIAVAVVAGLAALFAGIFFFALTLTKGVADAGTEFLAKIGSGKIKEAYESRSTSPRTLQTEEEFEAYVKKLGLEDYASASWSTRNMENSQGNLEGTVTTRSGEKIPLHMQLIKESGVWKVYTFYPPGSDAAVGPRPATPPRLGIAAESKNAKPVPPDDQLKKLALETLLAFDKGVKGKDFTALRERGTKEFREKLGADKLLEAFQVFIDRKIDISPIEKLQPTFNPPPAIDAEGVLELKGSYPTEPRQILFDLKYNLEEGDWRLRMIDVHVPAYPILPTPPEEKVKAMTLESLMAFNKAVREKSFAEFHKACSKPLQEDVSPEKMNEAFKVFMDKGVDISSIAKTQPTFETPPAVNSDGMLVVKGSYDAKYLVNFDLKYINEGGTWKLLEINVKLP